MLAARLTHLIETHADRLTDRLADRLRTDPRTTAYRRLDDAEIRSRTLRVYRNLGRWLEQASEEQVEHEYLGLGRARRAEGVPLSQVVAALLLTRRNLWEFIESEAVADTVLELRQEIELQLLVVRFFDRAIYHTVRGYEEKAAA
ncbi:MAG: hypothetical protein HYU25_10830 [Candidatus Rokubacteria bacterium]|nr:hypothetical protein [Candidatus Rokubacteria bacterium]